MICSRAEVLTVMGLPLNLTGERLVLVEMIHERAERLIKEFVGYEVEQDTYTEYHPNMLPEPLFGDLASDDPVDGTVLGQVSTLHLTNLPVRSITSVHETYEEGGGGWPDSALLDATDYWLHGKNPTLSETGMLMRRGGWSPISNSIKVVYVGGWTAAELRSRASFFKGAVEMEVSRRYREAETFFNSAGGLSGKGPMILEDFNNWRQDFEPVAARVNLGHWTDLAMGVKAVLQPHRRVPGVMR